MNTRVPRRWLRRTAGGALLLLLAAQLVQPNLNTSGQTEGPNSFAATLHPPDQLRSFLAESCYDCHSDQTRYPWYARVQPAGWLIARHVREGRRAMNFSTFGELSAKARLKRLGYVADAVAEPYMPPMMYQLTHPAAIAETATIREFLRWADEVRLQQSGSATRSGDG